jgi:hypothetical protein
MNPEDENKIKKAVYQSIIDFSNDLRKDVKMYFSDRAYLVDGKPFVFSDIFYMQEFSVLLYKYMSDEIDKETFKDKIQQKIAFAHTPLGLGSKAKKKPDEK